MGQSYEIVNSSTGSIDIKNNSSDRARYGYTRINMDGKTYSLENTYGSISMQSGSRWQITIGALYDMQCYLPYEVAQSITGIPIPAGGYIIGTTTPFTQVTPPPMVQTPPTEAVPSQTPPPEVTPVQPTSSQTDYEYDEYNAGDSLQLPYEQLATITNQQSAAYVVSSALVDLTADQRQASSSIDKILHFSESAITNAASAKVSGGNINITYDDVAPLYNIANSTGIAVGTELYAGNIPFDRNINDNVRFVSDSSDSLNVTLNSSVYASDADNIIIENGSFGVKVPVNLVDENLTITLTAKSSDINPYSYGMRALSVSATPLALISGQWYELTTSKKLEDNITISLPALNGDTTYQARQNGNGAIVRGKYNPTTNMLEAKVNEGGSYSVVINEKDFGDLNTKATEMQKAIKYLASKGIINGRREAEFDPNSSISRAELTALIMRALSKVDPNADGNFSDVKSADWYFGAIGSAKRYSIVNGMSETTFEPATIIKKDQILAIAARTLVSEMKYNKVTDIDMYLNLYNDKADLADWSLSDLALATRENLVVKRVDGTFNPTEAMTRGDAAIILYRLFLKIW